MEQQQFDMFNKWLKNNLQEKRELNTQKPNLQLIVK